MCLAKEMSVWSRCLGAGIRPVFFRRDAFDLMERFGKIEIIFKADGIGDRCDRKIRLFEQRTCLPDAEISQIFLGRTLQYLFKGAEQMAAAQSHVCRHILYRDRIGIIGADVGGRFLHIAVVGGLRWFFRGSLHEQCECRIQPSACSNSLPRTS